MAVLERRIITESLLSDLKRAPIFSDLSEDILKEVATVAIPRYFEKGQYIFMEGDMLESYLVILKGVVKAFKHTDTGKLVTISILHTGDTFGDISLFDNEPLPLSFQAIEKTVIASIRKHKLLSLIRENHIVTLKIFLELGKRVNKLVRRVVDMATSDAEQRLVNILNDLYSDFGAVIPVTHQEVADIAGITRETASRLMEHLRRHGVITFGRGRLLVIDGMRLRQWNKMSAWRQRILET